MITMPRLAMSFLAALSPLAALAGLAAHAAAQGGGFTANDVILSCPAAQGISSTSGAILRCDPATGATSLFVDLFSTQQMPGSAVFDSYRQRVVFSADPGSTVDPIRIWFADGAGALQDAGVGTLTWHSMAPTGDGRIYARDVNVAGGAFKYLDATGSVRVLLDAAGAAPFAIGGLPSYDVRGMIYDTFTNALFVASSEVACAGGLPGRINVVKLPLSGDGKRVAGTVSCAQFNVSPSGATPTGWSRLPDGMLLLGADTNSNDAEPRLLSVDPETLTISIFASNGPYTGAAASNAACWSTAVGKALIFDTFSDVLRAFSLGGSGGGAVISTSIPISSSGSSGESPTMFEVPASPCSGGWIAHGAGLAGAGAIVPTLSGGGCPEQGGALFTILMTSAVGGAHGALFIGLTPGALPFKGGTVHMGSVLLTINLVAGGASGVAGVGGLLLPAAIPALPALSGASVFLQSGWSDAAALHGVSLSNGLELEIG